MQEIFGKFYLSSICFILHLHCIGYTFVEEIEYLKKIRIPLKRFKKVIFFYFSNLSYVHDRENMSDLLVHFS